MRGKGGRGEGEGMIWWRVGGGGGRGGYYKGNRIVEVLGCGERGEGKRGRRALV